MRIPRFGRCSRILKYSTIGDRLDVRSYTSDDRSVLDAETLAGVGRAELARQALAEQPFADSLYRESHTRQLRRSVVTLARRDA